MTSKLCPLIEYHIKNNFIRKSCRNHLVPDPLLILENNPKQPLHAKITLRIKYFERGLSKSLKVNFVFSLEPSPLKMDNYQKQKGPGTCDQSPFRLQDKFRKIP